MKNFIIVIAVICAICSGVLLFALDDVLTALYAILMSILLVEWLISLQISEVKKS